MLVIRAILFTILMPGLVTIYIPQVLISGNAPVEDGWRFLGLLPITVGAMGYFISALEFLMRGGGTPALRSSP